MTEMGAAKVVGIDVSPGMIDGAKSHEKKGRNEYFLVGDAAGLKQQLIEKSAECNLMVRILQGVLIGFLVSYSKSYRCFSSSTLWLKAWGQFRRRIV